jgi:hypothetical protein
MVLFVIVMGLFLPGMSCRWPGNRSEGNFSLRKTVKHRGFRGILQAQILIRWIYPKNETFPVNAARDSLNGNHFAVSRVPGTHDYGGEVIVTSAGSDSASM